MLQTPLSSIETKSSWAVATMALVTMLMAFGAAWIAVVALKDIAAEVDGGALDSGARQRGSLAWFWCRRHLDGLDRRQGWHQVDSDLRLTDDRARSHAFDVRSTRAALDRSRTVYRTDRPRWHQCANVHLC